MMADDTFVSVVACLADDADIVASFVHDTTAVLASHYTHWELVLSTTARPTAPSRRSTRCSSGDPSCRLLRLSRRFGEEIAIAAGLETAIGDFVAVVSPATDPPAKLPEMIERCRDGAGIVSGTRLERKGEPMLLRLGARIFYSLANRPSIWIFRRTRPTSRCSAGRP